MAKIIPRTKVERPGCVHNWIKSCLKDANGTWLYMLCTLCGCRKERDK